MASAAAELFVIAHTRQAVAEMDRLKASTSGAFTAITSAAEYAAGALLAMAGSMWVASEAVADWQAGLVNAAAIGGLASEQMWELGNRSVEMSQQFGMAATTITEGYVELTRAGFEDMNEIMSLNDTIMQAAIANNIDYAAAADVVVKAVKAFNFDVSEAHDKIAVLQFVANKTQAEFVEFNRAMTYAGSTSQFAGVAFEELAAMVGVLSDVAMEAGIGARGINQMLLSLIKNADEAQEVFAGLGVNVQIMSEEGRLNITELMIAMGQINDNMGLLQSATEVFTIRGMRAWLGLINNADRYGELLGGMGDATSYFNETFQAQMGTINKILQRIGQTFAGVFRTAGVVEQLTTFFQSLLDWAEAGGAQKSIETLLYFMTAAGQNLPTMIKGVESLLTVLKTAAPAFISLAEILGSLGTGGMLRFLVYMKILKIDLAGMIGTVAALGGQFTQMALAQYRSVVAAQEQTLALQVEGQTTDAVTRKVSTASVARQKWNVVKNQGLGVSKKEHLAAKQTLIDIDLLGESLVLTSMRYQFYGQMIGIATQQMMSMFMATHMMASSMGSAESGMMTFMFGMAMLNTVLAIAVPLMIAWKTSLISGPAALAMGIAAVAMVATTAAAGWHFGTKQRERMKAEMAEYESMPVAHSGMPYVHETGPVFVKKREAILNPEQADDWRAGGRGGGDVHIHVENSVITYDDFIDETGKALQQIMRREMALRA